MSYALAAKPFLGKTITVTGAASGVGRATATLLWDRGASLAISDISIAGLNETKEQLLSRSHDNSQKLLATEVDVRKPEAINAWIEEARNALGGLDHAANVAGGGDRTASTRDRTDSEFDFNVDLNLRGPFNCMRAQLKHMKSGSAIVNISSMSGIMGSQGVPLYSAAKGGLNTMTAAAAREEGAKGIRINAITPGTVLTPALYAVGKDWIEPSIAATPLGRGADPAEIAKVIAFLLSEEASFITGSIVRVDGGMFAMGH